LEDICSKPSNNGYVAGNYNTCFEYDLKESNINVALTGICDLKHTIPYTLVFVNQIKKVTIENEGLEFLTTEKIGLTVKISSYSVLRKQLNNQETKLIKILTIEDEDVQIAIEYQEVDNKKEFVSFNSKLPKIFCEFPLIGTEEIGIPFVVNSSLFNPNKDRTGIALTDKIDTIVNENKKLFKKTTLLFAEILKYTSEDGSWQNGYNLAKIDEVKDNNLVSAEWYKNEIIIPLRNSFKKAKLVELSDGSISEILSNNNSHIDFPSYNKENLLIEFWKLCSFSDKFILPKKEDVNHWNKINWLKEYSISIETLSNWIGSQNTLTSIVSELQQNELDVINWLNDVISFIENNNIELMDLPLFINQDGILKTKDVLFSDSDPIDDELKNILLELGINIRNELIDNRICIKIPDNRKRTTQYIASEIERLIKPLLTEVPRQDKTKAITRKLIQWFNANKKIAEKSFSFLYQNRHVLRDDEEIIEDMEKAEIFDKLLERLNLNKLEISDIIENNDKLFITVNTILYNLEEDDIEQSVAISDNSDAKSRISISQDAKDKIFDTLKRKGFNVPDTLDINYTIVKGIKNPEGLSVKIVVKSGKAGKLYFNPNEWLTLSEADTQLFVVTRGNIVRNVTLNDLTAINDTFHMRFNTQAFAVNTNLKVFAHFFKHLPFTHFIFETPESTTDYLQQFGLNERNPSAKELSADNENLLH
jgi:LysM repeat protein